MMPASTKATDARLLRVDYIFLAPLLLYLPLLVFEGALRYFLWHVGLEALVYIPKGLMIVLFWLVIIFALTRGRLGKAFVFLLGILIIGFFVGLYYTGSFFQAAFGLWVYTPMLYGTVALPSFLRIGKKGSSFVLILWFAVMAGLLWDCISLLPWTGFDYELGKATIEASRKWTTFGIKRCAGFTRASFSAAYLILFFAVYLATKLKSKFFIFSIWLATGLGLLLTTHKTAIGIYLGISLLGPVLLLYPYASIVRQSFKVLPAIVALIGISLPLLSGVVTIAPESHFEKVILASLGMRFSDTWPDALALVKNDGNLVLGRGLGGIGAPQKYFEPKLHNPADNMFLSLYVSFGAGMIAFVGILVHGLSRLDLRDSWHNRLFWLLGLAVLLQGWTINAVEDPLTSIILGLLLGYIFCKGKTLENRC